MRREKESQREQEMEVDWGGERLYETESENKKAWQTEEGEKDCSELGGGVGTEADTVDVLVELTERQFSFSAYILLPTCFIDIQIQSPVNQTQGYDVQALHFIIPLHTYIHTFTFTFSSHSLARQLSCMKVPQPNQRASLQFCVNVKCLIIV